MSNIEFYETQIVRWRSELKNVLQKRNMVTLSKLVSFALSVYLLYLLLTGYTLLFLGCFILSLCLFLGLSKIDAVLCEKAQLARAQVHAAELELQALQGDLSAFDGREAYANAAHDYVCDLDLFGKDSLFQHLNRTVTLQGEYALRDALCNLWCDKVQIACEREAAAEWAGKMERALLFRATGQCHPIPLSDVEAVVRWSRQPAFFRKKAWVVLLFFSNGMVLAAWIAACLAWIPYSAAALCSLVQLAALAFRLKQVNAVHRDLSETVATLRNYRYLIEVVHADEFTSRRMSQLKAHLFGSHNALHALSALDRLLNAFEQRQNVLVAFLLNALFLYDFHHIRLLDRWRERYAAQIPAWIEAVSQIDKWISMGIYRFNHPDFTDPLIDDDAVIHAVQMAHPLLPAVGRVDNNFELSTWSHLSVVTGANMAGKSTFLRAVGVNLVLALSGNVVCAASFRCAPLSLFTAMRTTDNLAEGTSYFHAELLRLRAFFECVQRGGRWFVIVDEMLKGTNSKDKLRGSQAFLKRIVDYPVAGLIATHDLELAELAQEDPSRYSAFCFEITHRGNDICYDYRLREGVSRTMNAVLLMKQMGLID